jgi:penicillin-binding protein 2
MLIFDQLKKNDPQLRVLSWVVLGAMSVLLVGLWYVQVVSHREFTENLRAQSFRTVRIPAIRGRILDRHGRPLAENRPSYNLCLFLEELRPQFKAEWARSRPAGWLPRARRLELESQARYRVASNLAYQVGCILGQPVRLDYEVFCRHYAQQLALPLPLVTGLDAAQIARFHEHPGGWRGVDLDIQPVRYYPHGSTAAHLLGYLVRGRFLGGGRGRLFQLPTAGLPGACGDRRRAGQRVARQGGRQIRVGQQPGLSAV